MSSNQKKWESFKWFKKVIFAGVILIITLAYSCSFSGENKKDEDKQSIAASNLTKTTIPIEGMTCSACVASVKRKLNSMEDVEKVEVSLEHRTATVFHEEGTLTPKNVQNAINDLGYKAGEPVTEKNR